MDKKITWLNVTGCPRSGTTALGSALNKSQSIAVLHEHYPGDFFGSIETLFLNQDFHDSLGNGHSYEDSIINRERDCLPIIEAIFSTTFRKSPSVVGTKFPGLQRWEQPAYPAGLETREINIIRNPVAVVNSYTVKDDGTLSEDPEHAFCDWLNSFNYAISRRQSEDFLWLLYEGFRLNENQVIGERVAEFLQIEADFDMAEIGFAGRKAEPAFIENPTGQRTFDAMDQLFDLENWPADVEAKMAAGKLVGYPLAAGEKIDLAIQGNAWKYVFDGFFAPEQDGSWTRGSTCTLCFTPDKELSGRLRTTLNISWSLELQDVGTSFSLFLDDILIGSTTLLLGKSNGGSNLVIFDSPEFIQRTKSITLTIIVDNPRNPAALGLSGDNRDLGIMIRSIDFAC
ncbi:hypothetical protein [Pseudomonas sp. SCB32]|uniref:hypothetical protein n=1 Tax=Pseudomonas sp. SCB32 TaxID=2653853 RepID=UPI00126463C9|nr:hypothetical protein [Pseudomonas sp. SCB32]